MASKKSTAPQAKGTAAARAAAPLPAHRRTTANREAGRRAAKLATRVGIGENRDWAFVVRESTENAISDFDNLMRYTLNPWVGRVPGVDEILGHGIALVGKGKEADELRAKYNAVTLYGGITGRKVIGWVLDHEGSLFILSLFSAAKTNERESNDFTDALSSLVEKHTVRQLILGSFSRGVRSRDHARRLREACRYARTTIHTGGYQIDMTTDIGSDAFENEVNAAVFDYKGSVDRLQRGAHALLFDGQWPKDEVALPTSGLAYKFRETAPGARKPDQTVVPRLENLTLVRDILTWGASDMTNLQIAERIAKKHGWGSDVLRGRAGNPTATIMDARNPAAVVRSIWRHLDLFETGFYAYEQRIPTPTRVSFDTRYHDTTYEVGDTKFLRADLDFHHELLPKGRWVDPEIIRLCREKRLNGEQTNRGRGDGLSERKPLTGMPGWVDGPFQYRFSSISHQTYQLFRRPVEQAFNAAGEAIGWLKQEADTIAVVRPAEIHKKLADAIVDALSASGVKIARVGVRKTQAEEAPDLSDMEAEIAKLSKAAKRARTEYALAAELFDDNESEANRAALKAAFAQKAAAEEALREAEAGYAVALGQQKAAAPLTSEVQIQVHDLAAALALLAQTDEKAPGELNLALTNFLTGFRAKLSRDKMTVKITTNVKVETDEGPVTLGPVKIEVANTRRHDACKRRRSALLEAVFLEGLSVEEARARLNLTDTYHTRKLLRQEIDKLGAITAKSLRVAATDCPVKETKLVLWNLFEAARTGEPFQVPAGIDPAFAAHIVKVYTAPEITWTLAWAADTHTTARRAIEAVRACGDNGADWDAFIADVLSGISEVSIRNAKLLLVTGTTTRSGNEFAPILERTNKWAQQERRVMVRKCPFCGTRTLDHPLRVPEVPGGILCSSCRRVPSLPTVTFPEDYLRPWSGPRFTGRDDAPHGSHVAES